MTSEEKLQAVFEAGFYATLNTRRERVLAGYAFYNCEGSLGKLEEFLNITDAVDWLYAETVGKGEV